MNTEMVPEGNHLKENLRPALAYSNEKRIEMIRGARWIGYTKSKEVISRMEELYIHPKQDRMPNLLVVGRTNNGKTMVANRFASLHPAYDNPEGDSVVLPVLTVEAPPLADVKWFYNILLDAVFTPYNPNDHHSKKHNQVKTVFERVGVKMLIIDEIHNLLAGHLKKQREFLNVIKFLGNDLKIPIVGVGIQDALRAIQTDPQLSSRFEPIALPVWSNDNEWKRLLVSFEKMLPLKKTSVLAGDTLAAKLYDLSEGVIGEISSLLKKASIKAIETGTERISLKEINSIKWVRPSDRRKYAELKV